jgi:NADPH-dependent F420 reductase
MNIGLLGGTGVEGKGLAIRFAAAGIPVLVGSRSDKRALDAARDYSELSRTQLVTGCKNEEMLARCEIVFLTLPFGRAVPAVESSREHFRNGQVFVDVTAPITFREGRPDFVELDAGSSAELLARYMPAGVDLVAAFKTIPAHALADLPTELRCDVFVCGDSNEAKERVMKVAALIPSLRPLDCGPLAMARTLERMTFLAIQLNRRYRRKGARFTIQGI